MVEISKVTSFVLWHWYECGQKKWTVWQVDCHCFFRNNDDIKIILRCVKEKPQLSSSHSSFRSKLNFKMSRMWPQPILNEYKSPESNPLKFSLASSVPSLTVTKSVFPTMCKLISDRPEYLCVWWFFFPWVQGTLNIVRLLPCWGWCVTKVFKTFFSVEFCPHYTIISVRPRAWRASKRPDHSARHSRPDPGHTLVRTPAWPAKGPAAGPAAGHQPEHHTPCCRGSLLDCWRLGCTCVGLHTDCSLIRALLSGTEAAAFGGWHSLHPVPAGPFVPDKQEE